MWLKKLKNDDDVGKITAEDLLLPFDSYIQDIDKDPSSSVLKKDAADFWIVSSEDWTRLKYAWGAIDEIPRYTV